MTYKLNPFTGKLDTSDGPQGPAGVVSAAGPGSQAAPSISFAADLDTGLYNYTPDGIAVSTGGTGKLFIDSSGRLLVGTQTEGHPNADNLTISSSTACGITLRSENSNDGVIYFSDGTSGAAEYDGQIEYLHSSQTMRFATAGAEKVRIDSAGNVGIGTVSAASALHVNNNSGITLSATSAANNTPITFKANYGDDAAQIAGGDLTNDFRGYLTFKTRSQYGSLQDRLRIDSNGNVGIGTVGPADLLHLRGVTPHLRIDGGSDPGSYGLKLYGDTTEQAVFTYSNQTGENRIGGVQPYIFPTFFSGGSERARIDTSGRLLVGTLSSSQASTTLLAGNSAGSDHAILRITTKSSAPASNVPLGSIVWGDSSHATAASINALSDGGTWASGTSHPTRLEFLTTASGTTNPTPRMTIKNDGNVGIGTTSPISPLVVSDGGAAGIEIRPALSDIISFNRVAGTWGNLILNSANNIFQIQGGEVGRFDNSGRLLVGTDLARNSGTTGSAPLFQVESASTPSASIVRTAADAFAPAFVLGKVRGTSSVISGDELGIIAFEGYDSSAQKAAAFIAAQVDGTPGSNTMPGRLVFSTTSTTPGASPTERMRITNSGLITTFADAGNSGFSSRLGEGAGTVYTGLRVMHSATSTLNGTESFKVFSNGNVENTNLVYGQISDIKLKENIVDAGSQWDDFKAVRFRKFNFKESTGHETHTQLGVIAQELELTSPGLVYETVDRDAEGNDLGTTTKAVKTSILTQKALVALQEAMERIEQLEANNASLEARLAALEAG